MQKHASISPENFKGEKGRVVWPPQEPEQMPRGIWSGLKVSPSVVIKSKTISPLQK